MTVEFTSEQESVILHLSEQAGRTPAEMLVATMAHLDWMDDAAEQQLIEARIAEADRGEFVPADEMEAAFQRMLRPR